MLVLAAPKHSKASEGLSSSLNSLRLPAVVTVATLILLELIIFNSGLINNLTWRPILITLAKSTGLVTAILLLVQSIDKNNPAHTGALHRGQKSRTATPSFRPKRHRHSGVIAGARSGFFYFAGTWLVTLFGGEPAAGLAHAAAAQRA